MIKPLATAVGTGLLLGACHSQADAPIAQSPPLPSMIEAPMLVFFDWDKSSLSAQAMATISQVTAAYGTSGNVRISNVGSTDASGPTDHNLALSIRRADSVKRTLIQNGVPAAAIESAGRGQTKPLVATADGVREPLNRRVELASLQGQASMDRRARGRLGRLPQLVVVGISAFTAR